MKLYSVYLLASRNRVLYTGVTGELERRTPQHIFKTVPGFTSRYRFDRLVHVEQFTEITQAIAREKQIKGWNRRKKIELILEHEPGLEGLSRGIAAPGRIGWCQMIAA